MKKGKIITVLAILILSAFAVVLLRMKSNEVVESIKIIPQNYEEKIIAVGNLKLSNETSLISQVSGVVNYLAAKEGEYLDSGSVLIKIDDVNQEFLLEQKRANYLDATSRYNNLVEYDYTSMKEELKRITLLKEQAEKEYNDSKSLYDEGAISEKSLNELKSNYENYLSQQIKTSLSVDSLQEGGTLRSASLSQLQGAKSAYENAKENSTNYEITVPWNSLILKTYVKPQDYVQIGQVLADIGERDSYTVTTELDEKYFPYITKDLKVLIFVGENNELGKVEGKIDVITPKINENTGTFEVEISLPTGFLYQASNLTVNIEIILKEIDKAITVPIQYLSKDENGDSYVYIYMDGKAEKTKVKTNKANSSSVLILEGLKENDTIIKMEPKIKDGAMVNIEEEETKE